MNSNFFRRFDVRPLVVLALALMFGLLTACAPSAMALWERNVKRGWTKDFQPVDLPAPPFRLAGLLKGKSGDELVVYIEGDGRAVVAGRPSQDPTPLFAQSLELAFLDDAPLVLYLARVGQYMPSFANKSYQPYWSSARLAPEVVQAASSAIDEVKRKTGAQRIHLVGFSGGGGLAVLLADSRSDVVSLVTIAGLLDTDWWVKSQGWHPLTGSLNPASRAENLVDIPQIHYYGYKDKIIVPEMSQRFAGLASFQNFKRVGLELDHYHGWTKIWSTLLDTQIMPLRQSASATSDEL
ncbi:MAG: alpha/beta hydrolase [Deltaproteobacteria bacterium]|jgi:predicted esterase|nr:alpha/beta hydrolase [Deltaproteobacteria bacterium]